MVFFAMISIGYLYYFIFHWISSIV